MAALTTMAIVGSAALGGLQAVGQRNARKAQEKAMREQEERLRIQEENANAITTTDTNLADVAIGRTDNTSPTTGAISGTGATPTAAVQKSVGGLRKRPSTGLGL